MTNSKTYLRKNLTLAWPLAFNFILIQSMLMIDTLLVAPLGEIQVAAMGIASTIVAGALGIETAISNGVQLLVGRAYGSNNRSDLAVTYWVGIFVSVSAAIIFFCAIVFFGSQLVELLTNSDELALLVESYLDITKYIILITAYTQVCTAFYNGRGNTKITLKGYLIEIPVNTILSYFLINGYGEYEGFGVIGAAWGSLIAVFLRATFFYFVIKVDKDVSLVYPKNRSFRTELRPQFAEIFPIAANFFVIFIGAAVYQLLYAQLELYSFVAITLIFPWIRMGTQFVSAWAQASAINISQALGKKDLLNLNLFISICIKTAIALSFIIAILFFLLSQNIHLIYPVIEPGTQKALAIIAPIYILLPIIRGYNSVSGNILRAMGDSERVLKVHFVTQWVISIPLCALLILYFKVSLFWAFAVMPLEELLKVFHFYRYTQSNLRRIKRSASIV